MLCPMQPHSITPTQLQKIMLPSFHRCYALAYLCALKHNPYVNVHACSACLPIINCAPLSLQYIMIVLLTCSCTLVLVSVIKYCLVSMPPQVHVVLSPFQTICTFKYVPVCFLLLVLYYLTHTFIIHLPIRLS